MPKSGHFTPGMQVNSANQIWSRWTFGVQASPDKLPLLRECKKNFAGWCKMGFGSAGRARIFKPSVLEYVFEVEVEGPPANDPQYKTHIKREFIGYFMFKGFGYQSSLVRFDVKPLAGHFEDGKPADQMIVIPPLSDLLKGLTRDG